MKKRLALAMLLASVGAADASTKPLVLSEGYVQPSGAILSYPNNAQMIDPYFPTKALMLAQDGGMNIDRLAHGWINWLMPRQETSGLFSRFCQVDDTQNYEACVVADADDSMMAMWIELLYRMAPPQGLPPAWRKSVDKAHEQLNALYNPQLGVYHISQALPVGLFMDNVEIYASLKRAAIEAKNRRDIINALTYSKQAERLKKGIVKTFWDEDKKRFIASTQERKQEEFYPDIVAQVIPMLHGFEAREAGPTRDNYLAWMKLHQPAWMSLIGKEYPWGLVAVVAAQQQDIHTAGCWMNQVAPHRHGFTWDVLDEAAFQTVEWQLHKQPLNVASASACTGGAS